MAAGTILHVRTDLCRFGHQQIQLTLRKFIELLEFHLTTQQMTTKPFAHLFLEWDLL